MSLAVRLVDERDKPEHPRDAGIDFDFWTISADSKLLHYVDPYGQTVLNNLQMDDFISEWQQLRSLPLTTEQQGEWELVLVLAKRCRDEAHLYLKFIGD